MGWRGPPTMRHFMLWQAWDASQRREPDTLCQYVMQLTHEVMLVSCFLGVRSPRDLPKSLDGLRLKWEEVEAPAHPLLSSSRKRRRRRRRVDSKVAQAAQWSKMRWHAALGGNITTVLPGGKLKLPDGTIVDRAEYESRGSAQSGK